MIVHKIIDYHAVHLFPVLGKQVEVATEKAFATGLLPNNESICLELRAIMVKAVENTIRDEQADFAIRRETGCTL